MYNDKYNHLNGVTKFHSCSVVTGGCVSRIRLLSALHLTSRASLLLPKEKRMRLGLLSRAWPPDDHLWFRKIRLWKKSILFTPKHALSDS